MALIKVATKGQNLTCNELDNNFDYVLDLANATGQLDCAKILQSSLSTCLSANNVIIGIQEDVSDNATAIGEVAQDLTDAQTTLQASINNLTTLIGNQNTTIADQAIQIASLIAAFNSLDSAVAAFNSRLLSLEGRVTTLEEAIASGIIVVWSGAIIDIPAQYFLCNGTNGTPDLRDRFIVGSGGAYIVNAIGGSATHTHNLSGNTGGTSLTINQMPAHNHNLTDPGHAHAIPFSAGTDQGSGAFDFGGNPFNGGVGTIGALTGIVIDSVGANEAHTHTFSATTATTNNLPPYYALAFIMKF